MVALPLNLTLGGMIGTAKPQDHTLAPVYNHLLNQILLVGHIPGTTTAFASIPVVAIGPTTQTDLLLRQMETGLRELDSLL